jgi:hypothetical protein
VYFAHDSVLHHPLEDKDTSVLNAVTLFPPFDMTHTQETHHHYPIPLELLVEDPAVVIEPVVPAMTIWKSQNNFSISKVTQPCISTNYDITKTEFQDPRQGQM